MFLRVQIFAVVAVAGLVVLVLSNRTTVSKLTSTNLVFCRIRNGIESVDSRRLS